MESSRLGGELTLWRTEETIDDAFQYIGPTTTLMQCPNYIGRQRLANQDASTSKMYWKCDLVFFDDSQFGKFAWI